MENLEVVRISLHLLADHLLALRVPSAIPFIPVYLLKKDAGIPLIKLFKTPPVYRERKYYIVYTGCIPVLTV